MRVVYAMLAKKNWMAGQSVAVSIEGGPRSPAAGAYALRVHYWVCICCCHGAATAPTVTIAVELIGNI